MKLSQESKERIREEYIGDYHWFTIIKEELEKYNENELSKSDLEYDHEEYEKAMALLETLFEMNSVVFDIETTDFMGKYYTQAYDLYSEMKIDLTKIIGYEEMWEEI